MCLIMMSSHSYLKKSSICTVGLGLNMRSKQSGQGNSFVKFTQNRKCVEFVAFSVRSHFISSRDLVTPLVKILISGKTETP